MVAGEVLGELEARELVVGHDAVYDPGLLEDDEVAVDGALGEAVPQREDLGDRQRARRAGEQLDESGAVRGDALVRPA